MGMFDYIRCEPELPDGWGGENDVGQTRIFQTKDFDCEMVTHIISKDGRLLLDRGHNEEVPLMERPYWESEWGDSKEAQEEHCIDAICGSMRHIPKYVDAYFHGIIRFYGIEGDVNSPDAKWHEYEAKFSDGALTEIRLIENRPLAREA